MLLKITTPSLEEQEISFDDLLKQSKYTLLYFYPKDDTPGCTLEAQGFNAMIQDFGKYNTQVYGVSHDPHKSHCKFSQKFSLQFPLIADTDLVLHNDSRFNTRQEKSMYGKKYMGTMRESFLLNKQGSIIKHRAKVDTKTHAQEVLDYLKSL